MRKILTLKKRKVSPEFNYYERKISFSIIKGKNFNQIKQELEEKRNAEEDSMKSISDRLVREISPEQWLIRGLEIEELM